MSLNTIPGTFTAIRLPRGRGGIRIPEFGLTARTSRGDSVSTSVSSAASVGAGVIGDSIGVAVTRCTTTADTTRKAEPSITATISTPAEEQARAAVSPTVREAMQAGLVLSMEITALRAVTPRHVVRPARVPAPLAATVRAVRPEAIHHAGSPASAEAVLEAGEVTRAVVAGMAEAAADIDR